MPEYSPKKDKTRRTKTGEMLMDLAKYFATVTGIGGLTSEKINWKIAAIGWAMALISWLIGYLTIPNDEEEI